MHWPMHAVWPMWERREDDHVAKAATLEDDNENLDGFDDSLVKEAMNMVESRGRCCEDEMDLQVGGNT